MTADGQLVALHDASLKRVAGLRRRVDTLPWGDVVAVCVRCNWPIPTLRELLRTFPDCAFMVDVTDRASLTPLIALLRQDDVVERVCVTAPWGSWLLELRRQVGDRLTIALRGAR